jgi:hypothetical protein
LLSARNKHVASHQCRSWVKPGLLPWGPHAGAAHWTVAAISRIIRDEPSPFVNIELHQAFVPHFQQEGLASICIRDIGAFHDLVQFERLLTERTQDIFSIIQHD